MPILDRWKKPLKIAEATVELKRGGTQRPDKSAPQPEDTVPPPRPPTLHSSQPWPQVNLSSNASNTMGESSSYYDGHPSAYPSSYGGPNGAPYQQHQSPAYHSTGTHYRPSYNPQGDYSQYHGHPDAGPSNVNASQMSPPHHGRVNGTHVQQLGGQYSPQQSSSASHNPTSNGQYSPQQSSSPYHDPTSDGQYSPQQSSSPYHDPASNARDLNSYSPWVHSSPPPPFSPINRAQSFFTPPDWTPPPPQRTQPVPSDFPDAEDICPRCGFRRRQ